MLKVIKSVYKKNRRITLRAYPYSFMISRITGGVFVVILQLIVYYYVFGKTVNTNFISYVGSGDYISYVILGQSLNVLSFATLMNVGRCLISEIREGTIDNFLISPAPRMGYFIGSYLEQLGRSFIEYILILLFGFILGMRIPFNKLAICVVVLLIASLAFFSVAILVSSIMVYTRDTYLVQNTIFLLMEFLCGVFYPIEYLPRFCQYVSNLFPLTPVLKLFRKCVMMNYSMSDVVPLLIQIFVLSLIYGIIGYFSFKKMEKKIIEEVLA